MAQGQHDLIKVAIDVGGGGDSDEVLGDDLELGPVGGDVELLADIGGGVDIDDHSLNGVVALGVGSITVVGHAGEEVEDETGGGVERRVLLLNVGWAALTDHGETETSSLCHQVMVSISRHLSLLGGQLLDSTLVLGVLSVHGVSVGKLDFWEGPGVSKDNLSELSNIDS